MDHTIGIVKHLEEFGLLDKDVRKKIKMKQNKKIGNILTCS